jgi:zeaxanthin glucosyltransferase
MRIWRRSKGEDVVRYSFQEMHPQRARITLEQLPEKLVHRGIEALVIDTIHFLAELVPMSMGIPYAHIWNVLHIDSSGATPHCLFGWDYEDTPVARARNMDRKSSTSQMFPRPRHFTMLVHFMTITGERMWPFLGEGLPANR